MMIDLIVDGVFSAERIGYPMPISLPLPGENLLYAIAVFHGKSENLQRTQARIFPPVYGMLEACIKNLLQGFPEALVPITVEKGEKGKMKEQWTEGELHNMFCNPIYAGVGPYPPIVADEVWVQAYARMIEENGAQQIIAKTRNVLLEQSMQVPADLPVTGDPVVIARQVLALCRQANPAPTAGGGHKRHRHNPKNTPPQKLQAEDGITIAYGSLYLDAGETKDYAITQIRAIIAEPKVPVNQIALGFDIVGTRDQVLKGIPQEMAREIIRFLDEHYPTLKSRLVGVTDNDNCRPYRDILITKKMKPDALDNKHFWMVE